MASVASQSSFQQALAVGETYFLHNSGMSLQVLASILVSARAIRNQVFDIYYVVLFERERSPFSLCCFTLYRRE